VAIAHLFDLRPNDNYFAWFRFAGKKRDATGGRERDRATNARREPGSVDANCRERSVFPRSNRARSENVEAVQTRARHEMVILEKGLIVLEVIVGIAPLLGLIGAVSGLVHVFSHLGLSSGASDTRQIALGIAEALNATVFGLSIAVPTLIAFSYFSKKVEVMSVEMETLVVELIAKCYFGRGAQDIPPPVRMTTRTQVLTPSPG